MKPDCDASLLDDRDYIEARLRDAATAAGARVLSATFHHFTPHGVTGVLVVQESHLAVHTWPERGYAAVDLFTCGNEIDPWLAYQSLKEAFGAIGTMRSKSTGVWLQRNRALFFALEQATQIQPEGLGPL